MSLKKYISKRNFAATSEPKFTEIGKSQALRFCVQKHAASHLHYDFRLELDGVLLSWAVPKGPSMNPEDKRLAMKVEDHPVDYMTFEGTIPKGNYGAGTVMLWDLGTYHAKGAETKSASEKEMREGLKKGKIEFVLEGEKLKGKFVLFKLKSGSEKNAWILKKMQDEYAGDENVLEEDYSVKRNPGKKKAKKSSRILKSIPKVKKPKWFAPMLAKLIEEPFDDEEWLFEVKWDGYRTLAWVDGSTVELYSRNHNTFNDVFPPIVKALKKVGVDAIFDGEIVALDAKGKSAFELIQNYRRNPDVMLCYYIFDLLYLQGRDLRALPLVERKALLKDLLEKVNQDLLRYSDDVQGKGVPFFKEAKKRHLEGIVAKRKESPYVSQRSGDWLKIKTAYRQEVVIGGFTEPKGSRQRYGALLVGVYDKSGKLEYIGDVGTGYDRATLDEVYGELKPLIQTKAPFKNAPKGHDITWVKPKLICEISFAEWTKDGKVRQAVFHGLRKDKSSKEVVREKPVAKTKSVKTSSSDLTHLDKVYWPEEGYTKGDMINYYQTIAKYLLPYTKNRPMMLRRYPDGIDGEFFVQKNIKNPPSWMKTVTIAHSGGKTDRYVMVQDLQTLLYVANLGSIELHPLIVHADALTNPDFIVLDFDPEDVPFKKVVETVNAAHALLEELKIPNFCKTSGGRGLHIYIPLKDKYAFSETEPLAELLAHLIQQHLPDIISLERLPKKRQKKIYVDYLQNAKGHTMIAPYSLRGRPHATVSTPLKWSEVNSKLDPMQFNIKTVPGRLKRLGDIFKPTLTKSINLKTILKRIEKYVK